MAFRSARGLARARFRGERARALFAGCAAHSVLPLDFCSRPRSAWCSRWPATLVDWPVAEGGSQAIARALASYLRSLGVELVTGTAVRAVAALPEARAYVFDTAPRQLLRDRRAALPSGYLRAARALRLRAAVFKLDFALSGPIPWKDPRVAQASTVHVGGTLDEITRRSARPGAASTPSARS